MKRAILLIAVLTLISLTALSQTLTETEPNGCITLAGGDDPFQTLYPGMGVYGSVSASEPGACLYFGYSDGDEYIEDLYALTVQQAGYYSVSLLFYGYTDVDVYLMDRDLYLLNPEGCGDFTCGITCGNPEIANVWLQPGTYIIGVSSASVYYCFAPGPSDYFLTVTMTTQGERPEVTNLAKAGDPFRLLISGRNFYSGTRVVINGNEWSNFTLSGTELIKLKKGSALKSMFPKDGSWVPITIISGSNQSSTILYNRAANSWQEGGEKAPAR